MAKRKGPGTGFGCFLTVAAVAAVAYFFGPKLLDMAGVHFGRPTGPLIEWGQTHEEDRLRLKAVAAEVVRTEVYDALGDRDGNVDLHVTLEVANLDKRLAARYRAPHLLGAADPKLVDDQGHQYSWPRYGDHARIRGQLISGTPIGPEESREHDVVFDRPNAGIKYLIMTIDLEMFGRKGAARFKIPASQIRGLN